MSDHEEQRQIGALAQEYGHRKGELNHVEEKLRGSQAAYKVLAQEQLFTNLRVDENGELTIPVRHDPMDLTKALGYHQIVEALTERNRLAGEVRELAERLRALAPDLLS